MVLSRLFRKKDNEPLYIPDISTIFNPPQFLDDNHTIILAPIIGNYIGWHRRTLEDFTLKETISETEV